MHGPLLLYVFAFLGAMLLVEGLYLYLRTLRPSQKAALRRRLRKISDYTGAREETGSDSIVRDDPSVSRFARALEALPGRRSLALLLYQAGSTRSVGGFLLFCAALGFGGFFVGFLLSRSPLAALLCTFVGFLPRLGLEFRRHKRMRRFEEQLPQAIELLTRALRAGHSITFGIQMVGDEMPDPVGTEFAQIGEEIGLGMDVRQALGNFARRIRTADASFLVTAILIQRETGGNLAEILSNLASVIRERLKFYGKVRALVAQTKASANILLVMPFVMVGALALSNRDYVAPLWETPEGRWMCFVSTIAVFLGYALCRRLAVVRA